MCEVDLQDFYYDNLRNIEISQGRDKVLIEKKNAKVAWIISTDSKMIGDYLCYKATYQEPYVSRRSGQKNYTNVVAWFAPMLPYGYGPIQFYGLPGLILELQYKNTTYLATNIKVSNASRTIYSPKGKTVSKEENQYMYIFICSVITLMLYIFVFLSVGNE